MEFALFYEIPVPAPWGPDSERIAYHNTLEQAIAGDRHGWHAFWTVEHHFLPEFSHCSNPEVLYGAVAARTERIRIGYGVRLMPKPYNHPVRTAESVAVLDLLSNGRVEVGTGRSSTRAELEGFGIDPLETRAMWREAIELTVGCWTNDEHSFEGRYWSLPPRPVLPKPLQKPHPPLWGATTSDDGHREVGSLGLGLCSFAVGVPPEEVKRRIDIWRDAIDQCTEPLGATVNRRAATFTMALCDTDRDRAWATARESFEWYPATGARQIATLADLMAEQQRDLGNYAYAGDMRQHRDEGTFGQLRLEHLVDSGACLLGTPADCLETCRRYEAAGVDLLLCLVNPYKIPHEAVMRTIELMGSEVIPHFA
ncbi:MAG TPA: LLM class flavin-dependent oxidoreductase [Acidimicrobiales bacterium]